MSCVIVQLNSKNCCQQKRRLPSKDPLDKLGTIVKLVKQQQLKALLAASKAVSKTDSMLQQHSTHSIRTTAVLPSVASCFSFLLCYWLLLSSWDLRLAILWRYHDFIALRVFKINLLHVLCGVLERTHSLRLFILSVQQNYSRTAFILYACV